MRLTPPSTPLRDTAADLAQGRNLAWGLVLAIAVYFGVHAAIRSLMGGAYEMDEAEMVLLSRHLAWGYGPQLPAYNWLQWLSFQIFGVTPFAVAGLKNLCLAAIYLALFRSLRRAYPVVPAIMGTLSLLFLPHFFWDGQRASTHSTLMMLAMAGALGGLLGVARQGRARDYGELAGWLALGAVSKYNFWLFALPLWLAMAAEPAWRRRLTHPAMLGGLVAAALALAGPLLWALEHPRSALSSTAKFYLTDADMTLAPWLQGLVKFAGNSVLGLLILAVLAAILAWRGGRTRAFSLASADQRALWRACWRAFGLAMALSLAAVLASGAADVKGRWLLPAFVLIAPVLLAQLSLGAPRTRLRGIAIFALCLCLAAWAGMAEMRLRGSGSDSLRIDLLAAELAPQMQDGQALLLSDYYYAGNLVAQHPDWRVQSWVDPLPPGPVARYLVLAGRIDEAGARALLPADPALAAQHRRLAIPYADPSYRPRNMDLWRFAPVAR